MNERMATMALEQLMLAFAKADPDYSPGGAIEWSDIELALEYAREAMPGRYQEIIEESKETNE